MRWDKSHLIRLIRSSPSESKRLEKIIETFDTDKDGKVFIKDIIEMAKKAEELEGHGVVLKDSRKK